MTYVDPNTLCANCGCARSAHEALALVHDRPPPGAAFKVMPLSHLGLEHHYYVMEAPLKVISPLRDDQGQYVQDFDAWLEEHERLIVPGHDVDPKQVIQNVVKWGRLDQANRTCPGFAEPLSEPAPGTEVEGSPEAARTRSARKPWRARTLSNAAMMREKIEEIRESLPDAESLLSGHTRLQEDPEDAPETKPAEEAPPIPTEEVAGDIPPRPPMVLPSVLKRFQRLRASRAETEPAPADAPPDPAEETATDAPSLTEEEALALITASDASYQPPQLTEEEATALISTSTPEPTQPATEDDER